MGQASPFSPSLCLATPSPSGAAPAPPSPSQALPLPSRSRAPPPSLPQGQAPPPSHSLVGRLSLTLDRTRSPSSASFLPFDIVSPVPSHSPRKTPKTPVGTPRPLQGPRPPASPVPPQTPLLNPGPSYPRPPAPAQRTIWRRGDSAWPNQWGLTARRPAQTKTHTRGQAERPGGTVWRTIAGRESDAGAGAAGRAGRAAPGLRGAPGRAGRAAGGGGAAEFPGAAGLRAHWPAPCRYVTPGKRENPHASRGLGGGAGREEEAGAQEGPGPRRCPLLWLRPLSPAWGHSQPTHGASKKTEACPPQGCQPDLTCCFCLEGKLWDQEVNRAPQLPMMIIFSKPPWSLYSSVP